LEIKFPQRNNNEVFERDLYDKDISHTPSKTPQQILREQMGLYIFENPVGDPVEEMSDSSSSWSGWEKDNDNDKNISI